jgi:hypothetical protein
MSSRKALVAVLALVISLFALGLGGSANAGRGASDRAGETPAKGGIPRTYDAALQRFGNATGVDRRYKRFLTPSGNIYCAIKVRGLPTACEINEGAIKDLDVCSGVPVSKYVGRIEFRRGRAIPVCNTDTIRQPGAPTLKYGDIAHIPGWNYACLSETIGVTCINEDKAEGFFLHRGEYVIFNAG